MKLSRLIWILALVIAGLLAAAYLLQEDDPSVEASLTVAGALGGDTTGYRRATEARPFTFPADHGPHPGFKTEWWYLTGNLRDQDGRRFGYQLTIFRIALTPPGTLTADSVFSWATNQLYMGHFTVTDVAAGSFSAFERFSRGAAGLAGARGAPFRVWLDDWHMEGADESMFPLHVRAREGDVGINLELRPIKTRVLQGDNGFDKKGPGRGNASHYYSYPRIETEGTVTAGDVQYSVDGLSWMDREWSTSALGPDQSGWDWFALHLSNGGDLMYYQIRQDDGTASPYTSGVWISPDGDVTTLGREDVRLEVLDSWQSSATGIEYPSSWRLQIPGRDLALTIRPLLAEQELDLSVSYWEGAVEIDGLHRSEPISGHGYVELTGYGDPRIEETDGNPGIMSGLPMNRVWRDSIISNPAAVLLGL